MKVNSEHLYEYINDLATDEKVKFKVYYDDDYVTEIYWNGESFEWDTGVFTSEAFFNPMYDFEVIEEDKKIEEINEIEYCHQYDECWVKDKFYKDQKGNLVDEIIIDKVNEIIQVLNEMREDK